MDGTTTTNNRKFLVDSNNPTGYAQVFEEFNGGAATPVKSYTLGDDVLSQCVNGVVGHLLYDGHGSTRMIAGNSGAVTDRFDFDAYGVQLGQTPNVTVPGSTDMLYSGEQFDPELQQQYLRARYYDQSNGRFNRLDPFGGNNQDPQSLHKYAYTHCDPVNGIDPNGMLTLVELMAVNAVMSVCLSLGINIIKKKKDPFGSKALLEDYIPAAVIGALSAIAAFYVAQFLTRVLVAGLSKWLAPAMSSAFGSFTGQFATEVAKWINGSPVNLRESSGRVITATFLGFVLGGFIGKFADKFQSPKVDAYMIKGLPPYPDIIPILSCSVTTISSLSAATGFGLVTVFGELLSEYGVTVISGEVDDE